MCVTGGSGACVGEGTMYVAVVGGACVSAGTFRSQRHERLLELELQVEVKLRSPGRSVQVSQPLSHGSSPGKCYFYFKNFAF